MFLGSTSDVCKEISDTTQRKWIYNAYTLLSLTYSKMTHAGQRSGTKYAEFLNIQENQIHYIAHWNINAIYKGYLTTLSWKFIQDMAGFGPKYPGTYYISCSAITPPFMLLCAFWSALDSILENFSKDITTKQFLKLLTLLCIIFLQDSVFLRLKYSRHPLFDYYLFFLPEYGVFAEKVLANSVDKNTDQNTLICIALPYLGQQIVDFYVGLASILKAGF